MLVSRHMSIPEKIEEQAALWLVRLERGLTAGEQDEFLQWLASDPRHGEELARHESSWKRLNVLSDWRPEHAARPNRDLLAPPSARTTFWLKQGRCWLLPVSIAAAALACAVLVFRKDSAVPASPEAEVASPARIAAIEQRTLGDGSVVELNRGAEIAVLFTAARRQVRLERGEASFHVARDRERPFVVSVDGVDVRAVGTAFNVRRGSGAIEVTVTEGTVQVHPTGGDSNAREESPLVVAGQHAVVSLEPGSRAVTINAISAEQIDALLAWHPRLLDFTDAPLSAVVGEFNRRNAPVRITIADPVLADTAVSASLRSDNVESFIRLLEGGFDVKAERVGDRVVLHPAEP